MSFQQINNDEIQINEGVAGTLTTAIIFSFIGVGVVVAPFLVKNMPWWLSLIGGAMILLGGFMFISAKSRRVILRRSGLCEITETSFIGNKSSSMSFEAQRIRSIHLDTNTEYRTTTDTDGGSRQTRERVSNLFALLDDNSEIILMSQRNTGGGFAVNGINVSSFGAAPLAEEAKKIADLFGVPVSSQSHGAMGIEDIGRAVSAIKDGLTQNPSSPPSVAPPLNSSLNPLSPQNVAEPLSSAPPSSSGVESRNDTNLPQ